MTRDQRLIYGGDGGPDYDAECDSAPSFFQTAGTLHGPTTYDRNLAYKAGRVAYRRGWVRVAQWPYGAEARADWLAGWDYEAAQWLGS